MKAVYEAPENETASNAVWLSDGSEYWVIGVVSNTRRGIKLHLDLGDSFGWFDASNFRVSDGRIPSEWNLEIKGEMLVAEPFEFLRDGFWERYYEGGPAEHSTVKRVLEKLRRSLQ